MKNIKTMKTMKTMKKTSMTIVLNVKTIKMSMTGRRKISQMITCHPHLQIR